MAWHITTAAEIQSGRRTTRANPAFGHSGVWISEGTARKRMSDIPVGVPVSLVRSISAHLGMPWQEWSLRLTAAELLTRLPHGSATKLAHILNRRERRLVAMETQ